jgi:hypothetical protein
MIVGNLRERTGTIVPLSPPSAFIGKVRRRELWPVKALGVTGALEADG